MYPAEFSRFPLVFRNIFLLLCLFAVPMALKAQSPTVVPISAGSFGSVDPVNNKLYVPTGVSGPGISVTGIGLNVVDLATNTNTVQALPGTTYPRGVALNPLTDKLYVTDAGMNSVYVYKTNDLSMAIATLTVGPLSPVPPLGVTSSTRGSQTVMVDAAPGASVVYVGDANRPYVTVIDGEADQILQQAVDVGGNPRGMIINPVTHKLYVATSNTTEGLVEMDQTGVLRTIDIGGAGSVVAVNPITNKVYVSINGTSAELVEVDIASWSVTGSVGITDSPNSIAVNSATNKIYLASWTDNAPGTVPSPGSLQVIDATNFANGPALVTGTDTSSFTSVVVDQARNKVYALRVWSPTLIGPDGTGWRNDLFEIDGLTDSVVMTVQQGPTGYNDAYTLAIVTLNAVTNKVYVFGSGNVLANDGLSYTPVPQATVPVVAGGVSDASTVPATPLSSSDVFETTNPTPSFIVKATSAFAGSSIYAGLAAAGTTLTNPALTQMFYQVDGGVNGVAGVSSMAAQPTVNGDNYTYSITVGTQTPGRHILDVYASYGSAGSAYGISGSSAAEFYANQQTIVSLASYSFIVYSSATTTIVTADKNPQLAGQPVIFSAQVTPTGTVPPSADLSGGTVTFYDGATVIGTGTLDSSGIATYTTNWPTVGGHIITAVYAGDGENYAPSTGMFTENIVSTLPATITVDGGGQTTFFGTDFPNTLTATVIDSNGNPVEGAAVTFTPVAVGNGLAISSSAPTNASGQTSVTVTGIEVGTWVVFVNAPGASKPTAVTLIVQPTLLTVTSNNVTCVYGSSCLPPLSVTVTGAVGTDVFTTSATTTATASSSVGSYPITPTAVPEVPAKLDNYTVNYVAGTLTITKATPVVSPLTVTQSPVGSQTYMLSAALPADATGTLTFTNNGTAIPSCTDVPVTVAGGVVTCAATLPGGSAVIAATYSGDRNYFGVQFLSQNEDVPAVADFAITVTPPTQTMLPGTSDSFAVNLTSVNGTYSCPVALTAVFSPIPDGGTLNFTSNSVTPGADGASTTLEVSVPPQKPTTKLDAVNFSAKAPLAMAALLLPIVLRRRSLDRVRSRLILMLVLIVSATVVGCGSGGYFSQGPQTYLVTITGTGSCGGTHIVTVAVTATTSQ